jgi:hypothetical protein
MLVRGTMEAELFNDQSLRGRMHRWMERGFSKFFLIRHFCNGKVARAREMGIHYTFEDKLAAAVTILVILASSNFYHIGMRIPGLSTLLDKQLIRRIAGLLDSYGHADFITDAAQYKLAPAE